MPEGSLYLPELRRPPQRLYRDFASAEHHPYATHAGYAKFMDSDQFFSELFARHAGAGAGAHARAQGRVLLYRGAIDILSE